MILQHLTIDNFKNIAHADIDFSPKMNCLLGNNGMGKSNLLDALFYLSFCKSFSGLPDTRLVRRDEQFMMIKAIYDRRGVTEEIQTGFTPGRRKSFKRKGKEYKRLSEHIGAFPLVMVAPQDIDLVNGLSEGRRGFIDRIISQSDHNYLAALIHFNGLLEQRNKMLRDKVSDTTLFEALEFPMSADIKYISEARRRWIELFTPVFNRYYAAISGEGAEEVGVGYLTTFNPGDADPYEQFETARRHDMMSGHTSVGIHRDDLSMTIDTMPLRRTASQGQTKTFVIAMRLAQYDFLRESTGLKPLLLLDDIFDKLDSGRVERIVSLTAGDNFGQIFITDTNRDHLDSIMSHSPTRYSLWHVDNGNFTLSSSN
ncbi:MAG: DNA replication and repair protein RecF [Muribaculaceae bacterium]|nr:DNA replication and repair protein RecF [Muribaculaceae bacterium]